MTVVERAKRLAQQAHEGQVEESSGDPYIRHIARVAKLASEGGEAVEAVAWLHDVLEDTDLTEHTLLACGIPEDVVRAVEIVSRNAGETYEAYIERVISSGNELAYKAKRADLIDHINRGCPQRLRSRYEKACARFGIPVDWTAERAA